MVKTVRPRDGGIAAKLHAAVLLLVAASGACLAQSTGWQFSENNQRLLAAQRGDADPAHAAPVTLTFHGHMAFRITSPKGLDILIDPWRNDPSGAWGLWFPEAFPPVRADIVLSTHAHFDHDAVHLPHAISVLERLTGRLTIGDVTIHGLADKHVCSAPGWYEWHKSGAEFGQAFCPPDNPLHMDNFIQVVETGGLRIAHWGDNRPQPAPYVDQALKGVDVLILPIDESLHLLSEKDIAAIIARYRPRIVIPAHYRMRGTSSVLSSLGTADWWVDKQARVERPAGPVIHIEPDPQPDREVPRVIYFGNHAAGAEAGSRDDH